MSRAEDRERAFRRRAVRRFNCVSRIARAKDARRLRARQRLPRAPRHLFPAGEMGMDVTRRRGAAEVARQHPTPSPDAVGGWRWDAEMVRREAFRRRPAAATKTAMQRAST